MPEVLRGEARGGAISGVQAWAGGGSVAEPVPGIIEGLDPTPTITKINNQVTHVSTSRLHLSDPPESMRL